MRTVINTFPAYRDDIADLTTRRPVPGPGIDRLGAFLFLNHHGPQQYPPGNHGLPFGPHPHRGFETVTFILEGELAHSDSGGHESIITAGGVQWMTAGDGLVHAELSPESFRQQGGSLEILQLWINLPAALKRVPPSYQGLQKESIPGLVVADGQGELELIAGEFDNRQGPVASLTGVFMSVIRLKAGASLSLPVPDGRDIFLYTVSGSFHTAGRQVDHWQLAEISGDNGPLEITAATDCVLLFGHADPINEPVVARGPFVMNTLAEIHEAYDDYRAGKFDRAVTF